MSLQFLAVLLLIPFALWGCSQEGQKPASPVIATVNGEIITQDEYDIALKSLGHDEGADSDAADLQTIQEETLNQLIERKLLLQEAKQRGINATREEVQEVLSQMQGEYTGSEFNQLLKSSGLTLDRWKQDITENLMIDKLIDTALTQGIRITDGEIKDYYQTHRAEFEKGEEVRARQIVVATEEEARIIHQQLLEGANFAQLAIEKSISPDGAAGGDLGFFKKGQMPEEFDIVFTLKANAISPIVKSPYGYHIFKVEERHLPRLQTINEVREMIYQELLTAKKDRFRTEWIKELRSKANIQINFALLQKQHGSKKQ